MASVTPDRSKCVSFDGRFVCAFLVCPIYIIACCADSLDSCTHVLVFQEVRFLPHDPQHPPPPAPRARAQHPRSPPPQPPPCVQHPRRYGSRGPSSSWSVPRSADSRCGEACPHAPSPPGCALSDRLHASRPPTDWRFGPGRRHCLADGCLVLAGDVDERDGPALPLPADLCNSSRSACAMREVAWHSGIAQCAAVRR